MRISRLAGLAVLVFMFVPVVALGAAPDGKTLFERGVVGVPCATCHGPGGQGSGGGQFPVLAGLPATYVAAQLEAFADGSRSNGVMAPFVGHLSADDRIAIGTYVAGLPSSYPPAPGGDAAMLSRGQALVTIGDESKGVPACIACHGPGLHGGGPAIPPLAGQWQSYLVTQLTAFHNGTRRTGQQNLMGVVGAKLSVDDIRALAAYIASLRPGDRPEIPREAASGWKAVPQAPDSFVPPPEESMPTTADYGKMLLFGQRVFDDTPKYAANYVGNRMSCRNCHLARGRDSHSAPLWAAVPQYPKYRGKNKKVNTFAMRMQGCFIYSENGKVPPADSDVMVGLLTYAHWMATGLPAGIKPAAAGYPKIANPPQTPSRERGAKVFAAKCAMCHGSDGQGTVVSGETVFPALWGRDSFNWGAGMHRVNTAAAFIKAAMPFGLGGSLDDQDAWDVAAFINSHPRPQDPRFKGDTEATRKAFHKNHPYDFYGTRVDGKLLGGP
jgi:thiosulfate dehydrogenase